MKSILEKQMPENAMSHAETHSFDLDTLRHSTAHLLAQAVLRLYPHAQMATGPVTSDGYFYDFFIDHQSITQEDLAIIESHMHSIAEEALPIVRHEMSWQEAYHFLSKHKQTLKLEILQRIPKQETLSIYQQGDFFDLCRGPHVQNTKYLKHFKLTHVSGVHWSLQPSIQLQRIYGVAFVSSQDLDLYFKQREEAIARDHRLLGQKHQLFHFQPESPGMVFWHPKGWALYQIIEQYIRRTIKKHGYEEVRTPQIVHLDLWNRSGHWEKFQDAMFITQTEDRTFAIKPMNCPCHIQIFNQGIKSFRDLPVRLSEFGACHRKEPSGSLHGLMRVRGFTQDDAHIFCTHEQIQSEIVTFIHLVQAVYRDFGFEKISVKLSTRPTHHLGDEALWDQSESILKQALEEVGLTWELQTGEGAFYGPKIEFSLQDCLGRVWQCGTAQLDLCMPERLGALYVDSDGQKKTPALIHRAILGSIERFIGILIEHYAGAFPLWLSPVQVHILTIADRHLPYANQVLEQLLSKGFRAVLDSRNEKINLKIREASIEKSPFILIIGDREVDQKNISVRTRSGATQGHMTIDQFQQECLLAT